MLDAYKNGETPAFGPQNGRNKCEGVSGRTTLKGEPSGPFCRDLDAA